MTEKITKEINEYETIIYRNENGEFHNINDEPAIVWSSGSKHWYKNNKPHRTKGPAIIFSNGDEYWWYEGIDITEKVEQLMEEGKISSDWQNWTEEDEFLFILLVS